MPRHALIRLAERAPLLPGAQQVVFVDLDSAHRERLVHAAMRYEMSASALALVCAAHSRTRS